MYERYCELRDNLGYKDADVVRLSGVTKSTFSDWKAGRSVPKREKLEKIANALNVSIDYLMTGKTFDQYSDEVAMIIARTVKDENKSKRIRKLDQLTHDELKLVDNLIDTLLDNKKNRGAS